MKIKILVSKELKLIVEESGVITFPLSKGCPFEISELCKKIIKFIASFDVKEIYLEFSGVCDPNAQKIFNLMNLYQRSMKLTFKINTKNNIKLSDEFSTLLNIFEKYNDTVHSPSNHITPDTFVTLVKDEIKKYNVKNVYIEEIILEDDSKFPSIYAVGKAGVSKPRLLTVFFGNREEVDFCLVGKGVCYDSGGLCLKPGRSMMNMHYDMAGAALAFFSSLTTYILFEKSIACVMPLVENLIDSNSYRTGDIIKTLSGKTIHIGNTDAEGRVILADAVTYACKNIKHKHLITMATLTGACKVALGNGYSAFITSCDEMANEISKVGQSTGELVWRLPKNNHFIKTLTTSDFNADITNVNYEFGAGTILGGVFIEFFYEYNNNSTFTHFDIASLYDKSLSKGLSNMLMLEFMTTLISNKKLV